VDAVLIAAAGAAVESTSSPEGVMLDEEAASALAMEIAS
jgi:hypothetical protein